MRQLGAIAALLALALLAGCAKKHAAAATNPPAGGKTYTQITQETAKEMMARDDGHIVVDVRRQDEFDAGHIPGAVCIPNETIDGAQPAELPALEQIILVYCRSGNRSKQASQKLADLGYTNVYEFGGILDWTGEVVTDAAPADSEPADSEPKTAELSFGSFDGGGPEYTVRIDDPDVLTCKRSSYYAKEDHDQMPGAGYTVWYTFTGLKPGATTVTVESRSPIMPDCDTVYAAAVDEALNVTLTETAVRYPGMPQPRPVLVLSANDEIRYAYLAENESAEAFIERLSPEPLTLTLSDDDGFARTAPLPFALPFAAEDAAPEPGDLVLYEDGRIGLCYGEDTRPLALLASMSGETAEEIPDFLGADAALTLSLEWPE